MKNPIVSIISISLIAILLTSCAPKYDRWTSTNIVDSFKASNLEVGSYRAMTVDDYGPAPLQAKEGTRFFIPSMCDDCGGRILAFSDQKGLEATQHYYEELGKGSAAFFSWVFVKDNILVQINGELSEEKARQYEKVLNNLK